MSQGILSFQYNLQKNFKGTTQYSGLAVFIELIYASGLHRSIQNNICARTGTQGYTDFQLLLSLILLNLSGGKCIEHINLLEQDNGLTRLIRHLEQHELSRVAKVNVQKRWRQKHSRTFPSPTTMFNYLRYYHDSKTMEQAYQGKATIPPLSTLQKNLLQVLKEQIYYAQQINPVETATIDQDATLVETHKKNALRCYKGYKAYQPVNTYWYEQGLLIHSEFRDGNVTANYDLLRVC